MLVQSRKLFFSGAILFSFLVIGLIASNILIKQNQDNRQQASMGTVPYMLLPVSGTCPDDLKPITSNGETRCYDQALIQPGLTGNCRSGYQLIVVNEVNLCEPIPAATNSPSPTLTPEASLGAQGIASTTYSGSRPDSRGDCGGVWMNIFVTCQEMF